MVRLAWEVVFLRISLLELVLQVMNWDEVKKGKP